MLALEQMVQRKRRGGAIRSGAIGFQPTRDDVGGSRDAFFFSFSSALKAGLPSG